MADFATMRFQLNTNTNGSPTWTNVPATGAGTGQELRFSDLSNQGSTASTSWPFTTRPTSGTSGVDYLYVFTADTTSLGSIGGGTWRYRLAGTGTVVAAAEGTLRVTRRRVV